MKCPKCGFVQPENPECLNCGILVSRYKPAEERPVAEPALPPPTFRTVDGDPFAQPIRPGLRFARTGAGVIGLAVGAWLFGAGQDLDLAPLPVLFLIGYACVSLFWIVSFPIRVPVRQFAVEMLIFVVATLLLRVGLPEAFDLGRLSNKHSAPMGAGLVNPEFVEKATPRLFARGADDLCTLSRAVLDDPEDRAALDKWKEEAERLRALFRSLASAERQQCEKMYKAMVTLESKLLAVVGDQPSVEAFEQAFIGVETLEREAFGFLQ